MCFAVDFLAPAAIAVNERPALPAAPLTARLSRCLVVVKSWAPKLSSDDANLTPNMNKVLKTPPNAFFTPEN